VGLLRKFQLKGVLYFRVISVSGKSNCRSSAFNITDVLTIVCKKLFLTSILDKKMNLVVITLRGETLRFWSFLAKVNPREKDWHADSRKFIPREMDQQADSRKVGGKRIKFHVFHVFLMRSVVLLLFFSE